MSETKPKLVPCPFCGGEAREDAHADDCYFVLHRKLNEQPAADLSLHLEVLDAWNRRSGQLVERVKELEETLRSLHERFRSCSVAGASAEEAYDSFYQFGVADVLSKARPNTAEGEAHGQAPATEWDVRGHLAASLTCWHRLTDKEAEELVSLFQGRPGPAWATGLDKLRRAFELQAIDQEWSAPHSLAYPSKAAQIINAARTLFAPTAQAAAAKEPSP